MGYVVLCYFIVVGRKNINFLSLSFDFAKLFC